MTDAQTRDLMRQLDKFFDSYIEIPRMRVGKKQTIETSITEEAFLLAKYLRDKQKVLILMITIP